MSLITEIKDTIKMREGWLEDEHRILTMVEKLPEEIQTFDETRLSITEEGSGRLGITYRLSPWMDEEETTSRGVAIKNLWSKHGAEWETRPRVRSYDGAFILDGHVMLSEIAISVSISNIPKPVDCVLTKVEEMAMTIVYEAVCTKDGKEVSL